VVVGEEEELRAQQQARHECGCWGEISPATQSLTEAQRRRDDEVEAEATAASVEMKRRRSQNEWGAGVPIILKRSPLNGARASRRHKEL